MNQKQDPVLVIKIIRFALSFSIGILFLVAYMGGATGADWTQLNNLNSAMMSLFFVGIITQVVSLVLYSKIDIVNEKLVGSNEEFKKLPKNVQLQMPHILCYAIMEASAINGFVIAIVTQNIAALAVLGGTALFWLLFVMRPKLNS